MVTKSVGDRELINKIIKSNKICYVSMVDEEGMPYLIPMNFGYEEDVLYLHSAQEGKKISALENNPAVCILFCSEPSLVYRDVQVACSYGMKGSSVLCRGKVEFVENLEEKTKALNIIMSQYTNRKFSYSIPSLKYVKIWQVRIEDITTKIFGAQNPNSRNYKGEDFSQYY